MALDSASSISSSAWRIDRFGLKNGSSDMTNRPSDDDKEAERRFNETLERLVKTPPKPHKPHKPSREGCEPRSAPRSKAINLTDGSL